MKKILIKGGREAVIKRKSAILFAVILSLSIIALLGNPWIAKWFHRLFTGQWIKTLLIKKRA